MRLRPTMAELLPPDLATISLDDWVSERELGHAGIDLREDEQLARLQRWGQGHGDLYASLRADRTLNPGAPGGIRIENGWYDSPDAEVYASMIADARPSVIVEVGAGFSTLVARKTVTELGLDTRIVVIDPEPRTDVAHAADDVLRRRVETIAPGDLPLEESSILFIDSSHMTRPLGDVPHLFNRVVPALPAGTLVHVHDVFTPYDYPDACRARLYSEQYVLQALLAGSETCRTVVATHWLTRRRLEEICAALGPGMAAEPRLYGGSYWFEVLGSATAAA